MQGVSGFVHGEKPGCERGAEKAESQDEKGLVNVVVGEETTMRTKLWLNSLMTRGGGAELGRGEGSVEGLLHIGALGAGLGQRNRLPATK